MSEQRFTVVPVYTNSHICENYIIDYALWDKYGKTVVDELGLPIVDATMRVQMSKLGYNSYGVDRGARLDACANEQCIQSDILNEIDSQYVSMIEDYAKLNRWEKIKLFFRI
jgi:hypothetical protein